jgi:prepilin-type processing-associated H-X9-DG protein
MGSWNGLPFDESPNTTNVRGGNWWVEIFPYLEENLHHGLFHDKQGAFEGAGSNNPKNAAAIAQKGVMPLLVCPSSSCPKLTTAPVPENCNAGFDGICIPSYVGISGADMGYWEGDHLRFKTQKPDVVFNTALGSVATDGVLIPCQHIAIKDITDGASNTIMVAEQSDWGETENGGRIDIRSGATIGGFFGTGLPGLLDFGSDQLDRPNFKYWQGVDYYQATSSALTTVRWPINFKKISFPDNTWQWSFTPAHKQQWVNCHKGPDCGGRWSGLQSSHLGVPILCPEADFGPGGNLPIQSAHFGGAMVLFADGRVTFMSDGFGNSGIVDLAGRGSVLERLCVRNDGLDVQTPD